MNPLGVDCNGKPLYTGDKVVYVGGPGTTEKKELGNVFTVKGTARPSPYNKLKGYNWLSLDGKRAVDITLKKVQDKPKTSTWDKVEKITSWTPNKLTV